MSSTSPRPGSISTTSSNSCRSCSGYRERGNTVIVIEHNLEVIKTADWVVDLGPEGGEGGGEVVATGTPEEVAAHPRSYTGRFLAPVLARHASKESPAICAQRA